MALKDALLAELEQEAATTRRHLERVPEDKLKWRPHEKSMTLSRLATHLAELPGWCEVAITQDEFDISPPGAEPYKPVQLESVSEILELFDTNVARARELIAGTSDAEFKKPWTFKAGGEEVMTIPRIGMVRNTLFSHVAHHRGQLSVYLRLNGVGVPQTYGPSADEVF